MKKVNVNPLQTTMAAAQIDSIIADLEEGKPLARLKMLKALRKVKETVTVGDLTSHLSVDDQVDRIVQYLQSGENALQDAKQAINQNFLNNDNVHPEVRMGVCRYLVANFGSTGSQIWKNYLDGTFKFIAINEEDE